MFPIIGVESTFSLLPLGRYLNTRLSRDSSKYFIFTTSSENITITRHGVLLVTIPICALSRFTEFSEFRDESH